MRVRSLFCACAALLAGVCRAANYVGAAGGLLLPGNGNALSRAAETCVRAGFYATDFLAWEVEGLCAPNVSGAGGREALSGVAVYFTPEEAETLGAFEETAVEAEDVQLSRSANIEPL